MGLNKLKEIKKYLVIQYSELLGWEPLSVKVWTLILTSHFFILCNASMMIGELFLEFLVSSFLTGASVRVVVLSEAQGVMIFINLLSFLALTV